MNPVSARFARLFTCIPAAAGLALLLPLTGCGGAREIGQETRASKPSGAVSVDASGESSGRAGAALLPVSASSRKIIYNADVDLIVEDLTEAQKDLTRLVRARNGYLDESEIGGTPGAPRHGHWKVRVPVQQFQPFMDDLARLGELQRVRTDSQDVTEEYFDIQARLANKKVEEQRLLKHLRESPARLTDILAVEKELSRVREEAERMQGRLQVLADLTSLSTVEVDMNEVRAYAPARATGLGAQVGRTFGASLGLMREFGEGIVLVTVALAPWIALLALCAAPIWWLVRRRSARRF